MSWSTVIWSMCAAACLTLAGQHLLVWSKHRRGWDHLAFVASALAAAVVAGFELALMHATTTTRYGELMRWGHVPFTALIISILWFVRLYLRAGRLWLAWLVCGLRTLAMALNPSAEAFLGDGKRPDFDCLVLDIRMGGMTGIELQKQLTERGSATPVVFITAHDAPRVREQAVAAGCAGYFRKTDSGETVLAAIKNATEQRVRADTGDSPGRGGSEPS
jgi:CheY-like chemotaxis protein